MLLPSRITSQMHPSFLSSTISGLEVTGWILGLVTPLSVHAPDWGFSLSALIVASLSVPAVVEGDGRRYLGGLLGGAFVGAILFKGISVNWNPLWEGPLLWCGAMMFAGYGGTRTLRSWVDLIKPWIEYLGFAGLLFAASPFFFPSLQQPVGAVLGWANQTKFPIVITGWVAWTLVAGAIGLTWGRTAARVRGPVLPHNTCAASDQRVQTVVPSGSLSADRSSP